MEISEKEKDADVLLSVEHPGKWCQYFFFFEKFARYSLL